MAEIIDMQQRQLMKVCEWLSAIGIDESEHYYLTDRLKQDADARGRYYSTAKRELDSSKTASSNRMFFY
ncbi:MULTISPECIES: hypothetical protein [Nitrosomonas]|uniref:Uncharacterized protein n=1 Tax=Nitrosomonas communis TaxID=44574 RepID=A0A0F7KGA6_9PROT|nr:MULTISPECIES: hypothetical protein [Nitrosomonas]AKH38218.1 hypothetical protein AAW31_11150 [Nitrosomonas communis]TYP80676.1 hypothetical protein BCL69_105522 [Nitrosomonas communis]UVS60192.1 hypothetical protein NX761_11775 [Nitrosomonas sp. PLL12]